MFRKIALLSLAVATTAAAQGPVPQASPAGGPGRGSARAAEMFLARTGELGLSDAQVTRLAAIARRSETRRAALRAQLDSNRRRAETQPADTAARRQFRDRMRTTLERERDQGQTDLRDALAVLNADQQAKAWQMGRGRGAGGMRGARGAGMRQGGMRRAPGARGFRGPPDGERVMRERREMGERDGTPRGDRPMRPLRRPFEG